jgi:hypothetical protein
MPGTLFPAFGECREVSLFRQLGSRANQHILKKYLNDMQTVAHRPQKSRSPKAPAVQLVVCPDKN